MTDKCTKCGKDAPNSSDGMCNQCSNDYWSRKEIPKISTGEPSTLGTYRKMALALTQNENSEAVKFFDKKIAESPNKENEIVIQAESQMLYLIGSMM